MNDIRELDGGDGTGSGEGDVVRARAAGRKRCCQRTPRKKRDETIVLTTAVLCCFWPMFFAAGGSKGKHGAEVKVPVVAEAGGGGATGGAAEAREKMEVDGSKMVKVSLLFGGEADLADSPDGKAAMAVVFDIARGWHTYWRNAGDSGMPPTFEFTVEPKDAVTIGDAQWTVPTRHIGEGDILDYVYEGVVWHLFEVRRGPTWKAMMPITVTCKANWLVCKEACLPGEGSATMTLPVWDTRNAAMRPPNQPGTALDLAVPASVSASKQALITEWNGKTLEISHVGKTADQLTFFPFAEEGDAVPSNLIKGGEATRTSNAGPRLRLRFDDADLDGQKRVRGVVAVRPAKGESIRPGFQDGTVPYTVDIPTPRPPE